MIRLPIDLAGWRWYGRAVRAHGWGLAGTVLLGALPALANLPVIWLIHHILDVAIPAHDVRSLLLSVAAVLTLRIAVAVPALLLARKATMAVRSVTAALRDDIMARIHRLRWQDLPQVDAARAQSRIINDSERIDQMSAALFQTMFPAILPALGCAIILCTISWRLTLAIVVLAALLRALTWWSTLRLRQMIGRFQRGFEAFHAATHHGLSMLRPARLQASEPIALAAHRASTAGLADAGARMGAAGIVNQHFHGLAATATAMALLALGGALVIGGGLSLGALAAFFAAATQANAALSALIGGVPQLLSGHESIARLAELRAIGSEEAPSGTVEPDFSETLCFDHVSFGWGDRPILSDVSITIGPGSVTAIAAPNGQGKTTLIELALGLLEPDEGKICLGSPVSQLDSARYRGAIGMLPQNPMFLRGSIRENICFGREAIDADRLQRAVAMAALDTVLATLPEGIDTAMGDSGQRLSGGERQRVALARALIHAPRLLILDEPTNHLDAAAVALLIERLFADRHRPTILMTTHDPRLIAIADRVYELADGAIRARAPVRLVAS